MAVAQGMSFRARTAGLHAGVVVAFQANQLPCPEVEVSVPGRPPYSVYADHTLKPRFEGAARGSYKALSSRSPLTVRIYDRKSSRRRTLLGEATFPADSIPGDEPVYVWLPLQPRVAKRFPYSLMNADARQYARQAAATGPSGLQVSTLGEKASPACPDLRGIDSDLLMVAMSHQEYVQ